ncbi:MAG: Lrp/AsnC family transcriptional regulator [Candidatus Woesearchaeota archaeon]
MKIKDLKIVSYLRQNGRESLVTLSKKTGVPVSTIFEKLKNNFDNLIDRSTVLLNIKHINFQLHVLLFLKINREQKAEFQEHIRKNFFVNSIYKINNGYDYILELFLPGMCDLDKFLDDINKNFEVLDYKIEYISEVIEKEKFLNEPDLVEFLKDLEIFEVD